MEKFVRELVCGIFACLALVASGAAPDDGLLFYCNYDGTPEPAVAAGAKTFRTNNAPEFRQGVAGQAILIGGQSPDGKTRFVRYEPDKNLDSETGTLSLWVNPVDWDGDADSFIALFHAGIGKGEMYVYKFFIGDEFRFYMPGTTADWDRLYKNIPFWKKGQWHHVVCAWSPHEIQLVLDGQLIGVKKRRDAPVPSRPVIQMSVGMEQVNKPGDLNRSSIIDEVRIYGRALSFGEIQEIYLQHAETAKIRDARNFLQLGEKTASPDGRIAPDEYVFSGSGFLDLEGFVSARQGGYALSYDRTNFYMAFLGEAPSVTACQTGAAADRVEFYLNPNPESGAWRRLTCTPDNVVQGFAAGSNAWDYAVVKTVSCITGGVWIVEAAIPFAALGLPAAPDGRQWLVNIGRTFSAPAGVISAFPVAGRLDDMTHFGAVSFDPRAPSLRITELFAAGATGLVSAASSDGRRIEGAFSSWSSVTDYGMRHKNFTLQDGTNKIYYATSGNIYPTLFGDVTLDIYDWKSKKSFFRSVFNTRATLPLFGYFAYAVPDKNQLMTGLRCQGGKKIRLRFLGPDKIRQYIQPDKGYPRFPVCTNVVHEQIKETPQDLLHFNMQFDVDYAAIGPGDYMVNIDALDENGKVMGSFNRKINIPGKDSPVTRPFKPDNDRVPYPWGPVKAGRAAAETWGRKYDFSGGFLFSSLVSQGKELLAAPALLRVDGETLSPSGEVGLEKKAGTDMLAEWEKKTDLGKLKVESRIRTHFDGYCEIELTLHPPGQGLEIKSLALDIPVKKEYATLVTDSRVPPYAKAGAVSNGWFQTGQKKLWVGNEDLGFNWIAESLDGWSLKPDSKNVEILCQADKSIIRFNLVDLPLSLKEPRLIKFGFVVTPSRPLEPGMRRIRYGREARVVAQGGADYFASYIYNDEPWESEAGAYPDAMLYSSYNFYAPFAPEFGYWETQWSNPPYGVYSGVMPMEVAVRERTLYAGIDNSNILFRNFILNQFRDFIRNHYPPHKNVKHFMYDVGGGISSRYQAIAMYKMIKEKNPEAKVFYHTGYGRDMSGQHFADASIAGEGFEPNVARQLNYYDLLSPEFFRAVYLKEIWGLRGIIICQLTRGLSMFNPAAYAKYDVNEPVHQSAMLHFMGYMMTHDVDGSTWDAKKNMSMVNRLYDTQDQLGWDDKVVFHPYWKPDSGVRQVAPGLSRVLASAYTRDGRMLLAVLNDTDKEENVCLGLDLGKLGVKEGLKGHDVWEPEAKYTLASALEAKLPPRGFRLIIFDDK